MNIPEAYVGITDYAQHELGDITFVDVDPDIVGETLDAQAWIIKIKVNDVAELDGLLDAAAYEAKIG